HLPAVRRLDAVLIEARGITRATRRELTVAESDGDLVRVAYIGPRDRFEATRGVCARASLARDREVGPERAARNGEVRREVVRASRGGDGLHDAVRRVRLARKRERRGVRVIALRLWRFVEVEDVASRAQDGIAIWIGGTAAVSERVDPAKRE